MRKSFRAAVALLAAGALVLGGPAVNAAEPTQGVTIEKSNTLKGQPAAPGGKFSYVLKAGCSGIEVDCLNAEIVDVLPEWVTLEQVPASTTAYTVTYNEDTRELRVKFLTPTNNPEGIGLPAGSDETITVQVGIPSDTTLADGESFDNTAVITADGSTDTDTNPVTVQVERIALPQATKSWSPTGSFIGHDDPSTITLGVKNSSSATAEVDRLSVSDDSAETFDFFDVSSITLDSFPAGADRAVLRVKTATGWISGAAVSNTGALTIPPPATAADIIGVAVDFSNSAGEVLPVDPTGGAVSFDVVLRDTHRTNGTPIASDQRQPVNNCAVPEAHEAELGVIQRDPACVVHSVYPNSVTLEPSKQYFPDSNGNFSADAGEYAVVGVDSGVSAVIDAKNTAPFPLSELTITEPATPGGDFDKLTVTDVRVRFPAGATAAVVKVEYPGGVVREYPFSKNGSVELPEGERPVKISVTYTGVDAEGNPSIAPDAVAGLDVHGIIPGDRLTAENLPGGTDPGVTNCAAVSGVANPDNGAGSVAGDVCVDLTVSEPFTEYNGKKTANQTVVVDGQPVTYRLNITNNGTIPMTTPVLSDPPMTPGSPNIPDPRYTSIFENLVLQNATVISPKTEDAVHLEILMPDQTWRDYESSPAVLSRAIAIRASLDGNLNPAQSLTVDLRFELRPGKPLGTTLSNCFQFDSGNLAAVDPSCAPEVSTGARSSAAALKKSISPETLPEYVPGRPEQTANVTLTVTNLGNLNAKNLMVKDETEAFFDAVDFVQITKLRYPAGSDRVALSYLLEDGSWTDPVPGVKTGAQALPEGISADRVRGVRGEFSGDPLGENGGTVLTPCKDGAACRGELTFAVHPRGDLRSSPGTAIPKTLVNTVNGTFTTLSESGEAPAPKPIPDVNASLALVPGSVTLDVQKTPDTNLKPGSNQVFKLLVRNTGTGDIPRLRVTDALPDQLVLDESFVGDSVDGVVLPYRIVDQVLPEGTPAVPTPALSLTRDGDHVSAATWTFPGDWVLPPGGEFVIEIAAGLAPGVHAGDRITNTLGATSTDNDRLVCERPESGQTGTVGEGLYCTDTAVVTTEAGSAFDTRKWVAGDADLGWYHNSRKAFIPTGDASCPVLTVEGITYTTTPCVALTHPGSDYRYLINVINSGTQPAETVVIVDRLPAPGDDGVISTGRGTEWDNAPTLVAAPEIHHEGSRNTLGYASTQDLCLDDLDLATPERCADAWSPAFSTTATAFQAEMNFPANDLLEPGESFPITFEMTAPEQIAQKQATGPTIAWNSLARSARTIDVGGDPEIVPIREPLKVGIGVAYGAFELSKKIVDNGSGLNTAALEFEFEYLCTLTDEKEKRTVLSGALTLTGEGTGNVQGIPAGAECDLWESNTAGGESSNPTADPVHFMIDKNNVQRGEIARLAVTNTFTAPDPSPTPGIPGTPGPTPGTALPPALGQTGLDGGPLGILAALGVALLGIGFLLRRRNVRSPRA
ncbi:DUF5979 domain-containing protein [Mycetocola spongiae]|uniref:DUF5979 domain-containing protein n=1 Tax=Mycetocola spongiae TaxID=2859226 RepID=UPI001CF57CE3|nr:DUF5979 domain-containing protein [Mycetocola spongiae]UCR90266.1 hypothetical protein KXZ72_06325 [Mycetocola spongiae]